MHQIPLLIRPYWQNLINEKLLLENYQRSVRLSDNKWNHMSKLTPK